MNIIKCIFNKLKGNHYSISEKIQNDGMIQLCIEYYNQIVEETDKDILSIHSVWGYLRHIPRERENLGYSKTVYAIANKCFEKLFLYSQRKGYIDEAKTIEEFLYKDWYHNIK